MRDFLLYTKGYARSLNYPIKYSWGLKKLKSLEKTHGKIALLTATKDINLSHVAVILEALGVRG